MTRSRWDRGWGWLMMIWYHLFGNMIYKWDKRMYPFGSLLPCRNLPNASFYMVCVSSVHLVQVSILTFPIQLKRSGQSERDTHVLCLTTRRGGTKEIELLSMAYTVLFPYHQAIDQTSLSFRVTSISMHYHRYKVLDQSLSTPKRRMHVN